MTSSLVKKWLGHMTLLESAVHISASTSCVTWDKLLQLSEPIAFPKKWGSISIIGLLCGLRQDIPFLVSKVQKQVVYFVGLAKSLSFQDDGVCTGP